jgi:hypothetical protein
MRAMASSILRISLRSRSRVRSSKLNSDSWVARSLGRFVFHVMHGAIDFFHEIVLPAAEDLPEVVQLHLVHVLLAAFHLVRRNVARSS